MIVYFLPTQGAIKGDCPSSPIQKIIWEIEAGAGSKNYGTVITGTSSNNISRSGSKLFHTKSNMSVNSLQSSLSTGHSHSNKGSNVFSKMAKKLLPYKPHNSIGKDDVESVVPSPFSKFLHSSYGKHRSPVQFIHTSTGGLIDSGKSVYSFNPSINNNPNDTALSLIQDDAFQTRLMFLYYMIYWKTCHPW